MQNHLTLIVILGCQRSGTTLLGQILGAHPDSILIDEEDGSTQLLLDACAAGELKPGALQPQLKKARGKYRNGDNDRILAGGLPADNISHIVIKAPNLTYDVAGLRNLRNPLICLFAIRDVRDVVCSMARLPHINMVANQLRLMKAHPEARVRFSADIERLEDAATPVMAKRAIVWRVKTSYHLDYVRPPTNALEVRYEQLVADPDAWRSRLLEHAGLSRNRMARHEEVMRGMGPGFTMRARPVDDNSAQRWRRHLSVEDERQIWEVAGGLMQDLGYPRDPARTVASGTRVEEAVLDAPVIATGRGGSGTRILSSVLQQLGVFLGGRLNQSADSIEWVDLIYEMAVKGASSDKAPPADWRPELHARAASILGKGTWQPGTPWGWKLPETMLIADTLATSLPNAKFIHLVRDPLDTCLRRTHMTSRCDNPVGRSVLAKAYAALGWTQDAAADADHIRNAASWWLQVGAFRRLAPELAGRCLEVRYEDLCNDPQGSADKIAAFLDLPRQTVSLSVDDARRRRWTAGDPRAHEVWRICGEVASQYGYAFTETA